MRHTVGHIESEEEYFHRLNADLIDRMRRRDALEEQHRRMAAACQTQDPEILDALERLGFDENTAKLFCLVPMVHMAWVDGSVSRAERDHILTIAGLHGVQEHTPAHKKLSEWLERPPSVEFFEEMWRVILASLDSLSEDERKVRQDDIIATCTDVAAASGRLLGKIRAAKRKLLEEIERQLEPQQVTAPAGAIRQ